MQIGQIIQIRTNPATQLIAALAQNDGLDLTMTMLPDGTAPAPGYVDPGLGAGGSARSRLKSLSIVSVENLDWEVWLWGTGTFNGSASDPGAVYPFGRWAFVAANAKQIGGSGLYYYYIDGLDVPYADLSPRQGCVHLTLVNRSVASKSADAAGAILLQLGFENAYGW